MEKQEDDIRAWLALAAVPGLGCTLSHRLLAFFGSPQKILAAGKAVAQIEGIGPRLAGIFSSPQQVQQAYTWAEQEQQRAHAQGITLLVHEDTRYPAALRTIHDPPLVLYCKGDLSSLSLPILALVGSRDASEYGRKVSYMLAQQLAEAGIAVVSGLALGIDGYAHAGALAAKGKTLAVLGCGADIIYPSPHRRLYQEIAARGLILSEYPVGTQPDGFRFPARNRIISGLALGVVVVEAAAKSGSLITARMALEQNREVFAVPGRIDSPKSQGTNELLQQGAQIVRSVEDILLALPQHVFRQGKKLEASKAPPPLDISPAEQSLLDILTNSSKDIEELRENSQLSMADLHGLLLDLELKGCIRQLPGQQYERV